jgi:hypothetical protein
MATAVHGSSNESARIYTGSTADQANINRVAICVRKAGSRCTEWLTCGAWKADELHNGVLDNGGLNGACLLISQEAWDEAHMADANGNGDEATPRVLRSMPYEFCMANVS